jgi:formylmethanofuran dehydrogenase subunit E
MVTIGIIALAIIVFYMITAVRIRLDSSALELYTAIELDENIVKQINGEELVKSSSYYDDYFEIKNLNNNTYGYIFDFDYHFDVKRYTKINDYVIEDTIDYSDLDDTENIFFLDSTGGIHGQKIFALNGGGNDAQMYVSLTGCTYGKDEKEIIEIAKKVKITLWIENENGEIRKKNIRLSQLNPDIQEADASATEEEIQSLRLTGLFD